jgi:very-short-patch-repair endonuclease
MKYKRRKPVWNKGLTKDTDERVKIGRTKGKNIECEECGKFFYIPKCLVGKRKTCSRKCSDDLRFGKENGSRRGKNIKCKICGKEFYISKCLAGKKKTCSKKCGYEYMRRNRVKVKCLYCAKEFIVTACRKDEAKYCSKECYGNSNKNIFPKVFQEFYKNNDVWNKGIKLPQFSGENHWNYGNEMSEYQKQKLFEGHKKFVEENGSWCKGLKLSEDHRKKLSEAHKGQLSWNKGMKGICVGWSKGLTKHTDERIKRISEKRMGQKRPGISGENNKMFGKNISEVTRNKIKEARKHQKITFTSSQELKIRDFLAQLKIWYLPSIHTSTIDINIKHGYQMDVFIPTLNLIIECDGDFIHCNPDRYSPDFVRYPNAKKIITAKEIWERDDIRTKELQNEGYNVLRLWEHEVNKMNLEEFKRRLKE